MSQNLYPVLYYFELIQSGQRLFQEMTPKGHLVYYEEQLFHGSEKILSSFNSKNMPVREKIGEPNLRWVCNNAIFSRLHPSFFRFFSETENLKLKTYLFDDYLEYFLTMALPWK